MRKYLMFIALSVLVSSMVSAQNAIVEGYAFETDNRGFLREVLITVYSPSNAIKAEVSSNADGFFTFEVPVGEDYRVKGTKGIFEDTEVTIKASDLKAGEKTYIKMEMPRKPGYLFDVTLSDSFLGTNGAKNGVDSATIEIYNNTTEQEVLVLKNHAYPRFTYTFEQGNHYTVMVRKKGYFTKRMEAHVNIDGCILCFEGMGQVRPSDNLTEGNKMGSLVANVELDKIRLQEGIKIENIYYDYNKWNIRPDAAIELDKIIGMMKDNPSLIIELGSHTDARGRDAYNMELSDKRAKSAVAYIMDNGNIPATRITAKGYGETQIANRCKNGVNCSDEEHEQNRRTMIRVVGFTEKDPYEGMSLRDILYQEKLEKAGFEQGETIQVGGSAGLPEEIRRDLERQRKREAERERKRKLLAEGKNIEEATTVNPPAPVQQPSMPISQPENAIKEEAERVEETIVKPPVPKPAPNKGAFGETVIKETEEIAIAPAPALDVANETPAPEKEVAESLVKDSEPYRGAKKLEQNYTGYMIEFFNSGVELSPEHSIFQQYGQVKMEQKPNGEFAYLLGGFSSAKEAKSYIEKILSVRFPASKVVQYENGERVE